MGYEREFRKDNSRLLATVVERPLGWKVEIRGFGQEKPNTTPFQELLGKAFKTSGDAGQGATEFLEKLEWSASGSWAAMKGHDAPKPALAIPGQASPILPGKPVPQAPAPQTSDRELLEAAYDSLLVHGPSSNEAVENYGIPGRTWDLMKAANAIAGRLGRDLPFSKPETKVQPRSLPEKPSVNRLMMVTGYLHQSTDMQVKEISPEEPEEAWVEGTLSGGKWSPTIHTLENIGDCYRGQFIQGIGLIGLHFPTGRARAATTDEKKRLMSGEYASTFMPNFKLTKDMFA